MGAEYKPAIVSDRRPDHATLRLRRQPARPERIEEASGWMKTIAGQEKTKFRGRDRVGSAFTLTAAAYDLARLPKLLATPA